MTTEDEALKLMIEVCKRAINYSNNVVMHEGVLFDDDDDLPFIEDALAAGKEALAEPEQDGKCKYCTDGCVACSAKAQPEQETEEQRLLRRKWFGHRDTEHLSFAEAVDATMEKLYSQPEAWERLDLRGSTKVYTTPPQRTTAEGEDTRRAWVGLTDEEIAELHYKIKMQLMGAYDYKDIYRVLEAKLKEKNNG